MQLKKAADVAHFLDEKMKNIRDEVDLYKLEEVKKHQKGEVNFAFLMLFYLLEDEYCCITVMCENTIIEIQV